MNILNILPPREIEGADEVLDGVVLECQSGNVCRVWPAMTYDRERDQTRIAFFMEWYRPATPDDIAEVTEYTNGLMGTGPELLTEGPMLSQENVDWLRTGKAPRPRKAN